MRSQSTEEKIRTTEVTGFGEIYAMRSFIFSILHVIILDLLNQAELKGCCLKLSCGR